MLTIVVYVNNERHEFSNVVSGRNMITVFRRDNDSVSDSVNIQYNVKESFKVE